MNIFNNKPNNQEYQEEESDSVKYTESSFINGNEIYFYGDVSLENVFALNKALSSLEKQFLMLKIQFELKQSPHIKLFLNSDGGEIFSAFTAADRIISSKVPIYTFVEGMVASAATIMSIVGKKRYISPSGVMLVHQLRSWCGGTHENLKDEAKNLEMLSEKIQGYYLKYTKFSQADLDEILKHDIYLSAEECIKYGLADQIM